MSRLMLMLGLAWSSQVTQARRDTAFGGLSSQLPTGNTVSFESSKASLASSGRCMALDRVSAAKHLLVEVISNQ